MDYPTLCQEWIKAKADESRAIELRREIEDRLASLIGVPENFDGTENAEAPGGFKLKITGRLTRKVDAEKIQVIAAEYGLSDYLPQLLRWKPEINMSAWKATDERITRPLLDAVTTSAGRPSFSITLEK